MKGRDWQPFELVHHHQERLVDFDYIRNNARGGVGMMVRKVFENDVWGKTSNKGIVRAVGDDDEELLVRVFVEMAWLAYLDETEKERKAFFEQQKYLDAKYSGGRLPFAGYTEDFDDLEKYLEKTADEARARAASVEHLLTPEKRAEIKKKYFPRPFFDYR
jgi:hypothetical protein